MPASTLKRSWLLPAFAIVAVAGHLPVRAQDLSPAATSQALALQQQAAAWSPIEAKINSQIRAVLQALAHRPWHAALADTLSSAWIQMDASGRLRLTLRVHAVTEALLASVRRLGFEVEATSLPVPVTGNHHVISGWLPAGRVGEIAALPEVFHVRAVDRPLRHAGEVTSAGDAILRVAEARAAFGVSGAGRKVGVLSDGVTHLSGSQSSGDLPATVEVINNRLGGDEGTALLEIVHDLAPGAALAFADAGNSQADFANNILRLRDTGAQIICDDILYLLEPVFEDGLIAQTVDHVVRENEVFYCGAAGNHQLDHYEAEFISTDGDAFHDFSTAPVDESMAVTIPAGRTLQLVLQWNNAFGRSRDNYDLFVYDANFSTILARSTEVQDGDDDPVEFLEYRNTFFLPRVVQVAVTKVAGADCRLALYTFGVGVSPSEHANSEGAVYGHVAATGCVAVGAIDAAEPGNDALQSFSAHGPARIYQYDSEGRPLTSVERPKPELVAIDGVQTKAGKSGFVPNPLFGTSVAAPHVAGIAALLRELAPAQPAAAVTQVLQNTAVDLGAAGADQEFGAGRVDAFAALQTWARPDLVPATLLAPTAALTGARFTISAALHNLGNAGAGAFRAAFYLSPDSLITPGEVVLASQDFSGLAAGQSLDFSAEVEISSELTAGPYFLSVLVDDQAQVVELEEHNNARHAALHVTTARLDVAVVAVSAAASVPAGRQLELRNTVRNLGTLASGAFRCSFRLSQDADLSTSDIFLGSRAIANLLPGAASSANSMVIMPVSLAPGNYFIGVVADEEGVLNDQDASNNSSVSALRIDARVCEGTGDLNGDGMLTPGDALCAFRLFLYNRALPPECDAPYDDCEMVAADVNCDGVVTPGDALAIYQRYLQNQKPAKCFAAPPDSSPPE